MICSSWKPVPTPRKRGGALRYAWLRAPPLREVDAQTRPKKGTLDKRPHMKDPDNPTPAEFDAIRAKVAQYQAVFDTH